MTEEYVNPFLNSIIIIFLGLSLGYLIRILLQIQLDTGYNQNLDIRSKLTKYLQRTALLILNPIALIGALWQVKLDGFELLLVPIFGGLAILLGGGVAYIFALKQKMTRSQIGAFIISGSFTNIGNIGGLICYIYLGEAGYALVPLYKLFEEMIYYMVGFPIAKSFGTIKSKKEHVLKRMIKDVFIMVSLVSLFIGISLNRSGISRPLIYGSVNHIVIPVSTFLLLMTIGLNLNVSKIQNHIKAGLTGVMIKAIIIPLLVTTSAYFFGVGNYHQGLALKVILILSCMPSGFLSLIPPTLYGLDIDQSNTVWMMTTLSLLVTVPLLGMLIEII